LLAGFAGAGLLCWARFRDPMFQCSIVSILRRGGAGKGEGVRRARRTLEALDVHSAQGRVAWAEMESRIGCPGGGQEEGAQGCSRR
jgi:hypothetical protein